MSKEYINKILEIGRRGTCTDQEFSYFLLNLPDVGNKNLLHVLRSDYGISTQHWTRREILAIDAEGDVQPLTNEDEKLVSFIVDLVKGIHIIEFKSGYGCSSTTTICNLLGTLIEKDSNRFIDLYNWIASNGGNYYIQSGDTFAESKKDEQIVEKNRIETLAGYERIHSEAVTRKQQNKDQHTQVSNEANVIFNELKERFREMNDDQLIATYNEDLIKQGWVSARGRFHAALREEFVKRSIDIKTISKNLKLS